MTCTLIWQSAAVTGLSRAAADSQARKPILAAVNALAADAYPPGSTPLGAEGLRRMRIGDVRVLYRIDGDLQSIVILNIGRVRR